MDMLPPDVLMKLAGSIIMTLLLVNAFFLKRLVSKIESVSEKMPEQEARMKAVEQDIGEMKASIEKVFSSFDKISDLQSKVSVLEYAMKLGSSHRKRSPISKEEG